MLSNSSLQQRRETAIPRGVASAFPLFVSRAANSEIWDVEGRRYIDFAGGIGVLNVGHRHPEVMRAVQAQLELFTHTAFQVMPYESYVALAERLNDVAPFAGKAKTILFSTGAEAVENSIKIARAATGRTAVIAFTGAFHGRTLTTLALTGKVKPYKHRFGPLPPEIYHVPFPSESQRISVADSLRAIDFLFNVDVPASGVAAIIIEPVQGEGGFHVAPKELLQELREICDSNGILLIADEIQSGFARTGKMFAIEHAGVEPDLVTVAKSLAGGLPLSGVIGRAEIMDSVEPGGLGGTYAGNPVACVAALAVLSAIKAQDLCERAQAMGRAIRRRLEAIAVRNDVAPMVAIRGLGSMIGFDIMSDRSNGQPDPNAAKRVLQIAAERGLILLSCGTHNNTIRILVPLTAADTLLAEGLDILEQALIEAGA